MDKSIVKILKIKNEVSSTELRIEDCSEHSDILKGYYVVLNHKNISDVKAFLLKDYSTFQEMINEAFNDFNENGETKTLIKLLEIYKDGETYTKVILEENGGIEGVLGSNINIDLVDNVVEDDEEEMYKEMYEELKEKHAVEMSAKDIKIKELEEKIKESEALGELMESLDELEYEDIDMLVDDLEDLSGEDCKNLILDLISKNGENLIDDPSYDTKKLPALTIYMNQIADWLDENGYQE